MASIRQSTAPAWQDPEAWRYGDQTRAQIAQLTQQFQGGIGTGRMDLDQNGNPTGYADFGMGRLGVQRAGNVHDGWGDVTGYRGALPGSGYNDELGKQGAYIGNFDAQGNLLGVGWQDEGQSGWLKQNLGTWGPLAVLAIAGGMNPGLLSGGAAPTTGAELTAAEAAGAVGGGGGALGGGGAGAATGVLGGGGGSTLSKIVSGGLSGLLGGGGGGGQGGGGGDVLASLLNAYSQNRQGDYQSDLAERLMRERQGFVDQLRQSYDDPGSFLNSADYQAIQGTTLNRLMRQDAAGGRLANDAGRQKLLQDHAFGALENYRAGLRQAAGLGGSPLDIGRTGLSGLSNELGTLNAPLSVMGRSGYGLGDIIGGIANQFDVSGFVNDIFNLGDL